MKFPVIYRQEMNSVNIFRIITQLGLGYTYILLKYQSKESTLITGSNYREYIYWVHFLPVDNIKIS